MTGIYGLGAVSVARGQVRRRTEGEFTLPDVDGGERAESAGAAGAVEMPGLLMMQEAEAEPVADRDARRHGKAMLDALSRLQRALLGGEGPAALESLANLVRATPAPADPRLAAVQRAVLVRAAVELQRARMGLGQ